MDVWLYLIFIIGLIFGSFFNVVGLRIPQNQNFWKGRSMCPQCRKILSWQELIPVLSFMLQRGKCRSCHFSISSIYPLIELITASLFLVAYIKIGLQAELVMALLLISLSMIIIVTDCSFMIIPDRILIFFLVLIIIMNIANPLQSWLDQIYGALGGLLLIGIIIMLSRGGMGAGDMKLLAVLGMILGFNKVILTFFIAVCLGAVIGIYMIMRKRLSRKQMVPFGPYLVIGAMISYFYGSDLLKMYSVLTGFSFSI